MPLTKAPPELDPADGLREEDEDIMVHTIEFNYRGEIKNEGLPDYNTWDKNSKER